MPSHKSSAILEAPADDEDAETKGVEPESEEGDAADVEPAHVQARNFTTLVG
jgi:hypothetical protein